VKGRGGRSCSVDLPFVLPPGDGFPGEANQPEKK
jgi:hypothetical protein